MKAVIFDLDDTLLHKGIRIMIATARPDRVAEKYRTMIQADGMMVMNGAKIILPGKTVENGIPRDNVKRILSGLLDIHGTMVSIETAEGIFSNADIPEWNAIYCPDFTNLPTKGIIYEILASGEKSTLFSQVGSTLTDDIYYTIANHELRADYEQSHHKIQRSQGNARFLRNP